MILLLALAACLSYEEGMVRVGELNCALADACGDLDAYGYDSVEACQQDATAKEYPECPGYDAEAMRGCIDAYEAAVDAADCDAALGSVCLVCGG